MKATFEGYGGVVVVENPETKFVKITLMTKEGKVSTTVEVDLPTALTLAAAVKEAASGRKR